MTDNNDRKPGRRGAARGNSGNGNQNGGNRGGRTGGGNGGGGRPRTTPAPLPEARMAFGEDGDWQAEPVAVNPGQGGRSSQSTQRPRGESRGRSEAQGRGESLGRADQNRSDQSRPRSEGRNSDGRPSEGRNSQGGSAEGRTGRGQGQRPAMAPPQRPTTPTAAPIPINGPEEWPRLLAGRTATPVQEKAIPALLAGRDVIATARTGSGKTLAFLIPAAARNIGTKAPTQGMTPEVLIVSPTRELAVQIRDVARELGMPAGRITGGITPRETTREANAKGVISGTPGRLKDLIDKGELGLSYVKYLVLDEADELLSLGFLKDVEWIVGQARKQAGKHQIQVQVALASATFPAEVRAVAERVLRSPVRIDIEPPAPLPPLAAGEVAAAGEGRAEHVAADSNRDALLEHAADEIREALREPGGCAVVFCRTKALAKRRAEALGKLLPGEQVVALQGNMDQRKREAVMGLLRDGKARVLVATDIAGRGIDLPEVRLVIHADVASTSEDHVHRSGRTARAGRGGRNLLLLIPEQRERWAQVRRGLPEHIRPSATPQEHQIDKSIQEKQGRGSGNGVDSRGSGPSGRSGSGRGGVGRGGDSRPAQGTRESSGGVGRSRRRR